MESKKVFLLLFLYCVLCSVNCISQQQSNFTHFTVDDGLSQSSVFSIAQDDLGFMWFATEDGLNKFDGKKYTVYRPIDNDTTSLPDLGIRKVYRDKKNNIWILSLRGKLSLYNPYKNNFTRFAFPQINEKSVKIISLTEDANESLWAATTKGEFFIYDYQSKKFKTKNFSEKVKKIFQPLHLQCMLVATDGTFWIGTWEGLIHLNPKTLETIWYKNSSSNLQSLAGDMVFSLDEDGDGNIWAASANGGISVFIKSTKTFKVYKTNSKNKNSISSNRIMSILIDSRNKIWIGSFDKGLDLYDPLTKTFNNFSHNPSITSSFSTGAVMCLFEDKSGGIWIGTGGGGLNRYDPFNQYFYHIQHIPGNQSSISPNPVLAICEDHLGNLWVGSDGGGINIKEKNSNEFKSYLQNPSFGSNAITAIYEDDKGNIWIGADPGADSPEGALIKYDRKTNSFIHFKNISIKFGGISTIYEDKYGHLWITTPSDGVHCYNPKTEKEVVYRTNLMDSTSLSSNSIFSICEDSYGNLWFGSIAAGLNLFNRENNSFIRFTNKQDDKSSLGSNAVWCIVEDLNKNLWIGTWGGGVNKYLRNKNSFIRYTVDDGLSGNIVYSIIPDDQNNLWIGTNKGLVKFNTSAISFTSFDKSNGLMISDFSAGATFKSTSGMFYFGGNSGIISFDPKKIVENSFIPNVVITDFKVFDKPFRLENSILYTDKIVLNYDQNFFTIEFASLDYTAPEKNIYEYKLEGIDKDWIKSNGRRFASYTDINNGNYKFKVRGSNSSGIFNPKEVILSIIISPPFWKTWWFRLLGLIVLSIILYSMHKYRLNKLLEVEKTRNRIARDLHDEVSASITGIVYFADAMKTEAKEKETPVLKKLIGLISESATQIQESMSDIIWSINPDNDDWNVVLPKLRRYASDLCESKGIKYSIEIPDSFSGKSLKMEQRHDFWLVFKEIVTNAVRHSSCSEIEIKLFNDSDYLCLTISDNGIGFNSEIPSANNGVKNIRSRSKTLGGTSEINTSIGNGTQWKIKIPLTVTK